MFRANKTAMSSAIAKVKDAADKKGTIPILETILFDKKSESILSLRATNLSIEISVECEAVIEKSFQPFCVAATEIHDIVRNMAMDDVLVSATGPDVVTISSGRAKLKLPFFPARDFPVFPTIKGSISLTISEPAILSAHLSACLLSAREDPNRLYLSGVFFCASEDAISLVSTDGHRLTHRRFPGDHIEGDFSAITPSIVPIWVVQRMIKLMAGRDLVRLELSEHNIRLSADDTVMTARMIEGTFPDWQRVVPRNNTIEIKIQSANLKSSLQRLMAVGEAGGMIEFDIADGVLTLNKRDQFGNVSEDSFSVEASAPWKNGFNARYIIDMLDGYSAHEVLMLAADGGFAGLFKIPTNEHDLTVVMARMR